MRCEMKKACWIAIVPGMVALAAAAFVLVLLLVKVMWAWTVPDLFPGAVKLGLVAREISWMAALKVAIFVGALKVAVLGGVLAGITGGRKSE
jgi:hypothetical protein